MIGRLVERYMNQHYPVQVISSADGGTYLTRWAVLPKNPLFNIYIHLFERSDEDKALHDHPWPSLSYLVDGVLDEVMVNRIMRRLPGDWVFRRPRHAHRLVLKSPTATTLFFIGPRLRQWGFHCRKGWVHWKAFTDPKDPGRVGAGCGEFE